METASTPSAAEPALEDASTRDLTRRMAAGEEAAFRKFHGLYFDRLHRLMLVLVQGTDGELEDALQETLCRVARYVRTFPAQEPFWCWLVALARSAVRDRARRRHRYWALLDRYRFRWLPIATAPADGAEQDRLHQAVSECLESWAPADRALIERKYLQRASTRELAVALGLTERAVESRLLRLRRQLKSESLRWLRRNEP